MPALQSVGATGAPVGQLSGIEVSHRTAGMPG